MIELAVWDLAPQRDPEEVGQPDYVIVEAVEYDTLEAALADAPRLLAAHGSSTAELLLTGEEAHRSWDAYELEASALPTAQYMRDEHDRDMRKFRRSWRMEIAMEQGMLHGADAYNDALGQSVGVYDD